MTRTDDSYPSLLERTRAAEAAGSELFVSIHHDMPTASRPGVYYNDHPAAVQLAQQVALALDERGWVRSHTTSRFGGLYIADFDGPAILLELGPTAPYGRDERIRRASLALVPILAHLRDGQVNA